MTFWEKLKDGTKAFSEKSEEIIEVARSKSGELVGVTKLRLAISKVETDIVKKKTELGNIVYDLYRNRREDSEAVDIYCEEIENLESELNELKSKMSDAKSQTGPVCQKCGTRLTEGAKYCSNCGTAIGTDE